MGRLLTLAELAVEEVWAEEAGGEACAAGVVSSAGTAAGICPAGAAVAVSVAPPAAVLLVALGKV